LESQKKGKQSKKKENKVGTHTTKKKVASYWLISAHSFFYRTTPTLPEKVCVVTCSFVLFCSYNQFVSFNEKKEIRKRKKRTKTETGSISFL